MFTVTIDQNDENLCPPPPGGMAEKLAILLELQAIPMSSDERRAIYCIKTNFYRKGYCHARQDQIARTCGLKRMVFQRAYYELERRQLIQVVRRPGLSNVTYLSPGVAEALHDLYLEQSEQPRFRKHAGLKKKTKVASKKKTATMRLCSSTEISEPQATPDITSTVNHDLSIKSSATNIQHPSTKEKNENEQESKPQVAVQALLEEKKPSKQEQQVLEQLKALGMEEPQELIQHHGLERVLKHIQAKGYLAPAVTNQAGWLRTAIQKDYQYPTTSLEVDAPLAQSLPTHISHPLVVELVQAGVRPFDAAMAVKIWPADRIEAQLKYGKYLQAKNPPQFLMEAIRWGYATRPKPGSDHAAVYAKEQSAKAIVPAASDKPSEIPQTRDPIGQLREELRIAFAQLAAEQQKVFEEQAHQKLKENPPAYIGEFIHDDPATRPVLRSVIRAHAMKLWQESLKNQGGRQSWNYAG